MAKDPPPKVKASVSFGSDTALSQEAQARVQEALNDAIDAELQSEMTPMINHNKVVFSRSIDG